MSVCSSTCLVVLEVFCNIGTLLNIIVFLVLLRRKKPLTSREVFMFVMILNDVLRTTVAVHRNWWAAWVFPCKLSSTSSGVACPLSEIVSSSHLPALNRFPSSLAADSDNVWLCRIHFLLSEACTVCSFLFPAFYAIYECCTRGFPTSPLAAFLSQHKSSLLVDLSILVIGLCSPVIFVVGENNEKAPP